MKTRKLLFMLGLLLFGLGFNSCRKDESMYPEKSDGFNVQLSAAVTCSCVDYVKNQLSITTSTANAKDWGVVYTPANYVVVPGGAAAVPTAGDIMVMLPGFGQGVNVTYGHIGIIKRITYLNSTDFDITLRGANQGGSSTEVSCSNVNDFTYQVRSTNRANTRYLRRNPNFSYVNSSFFPIGAFATSYIPALSSYTACGGTAVYGSCSASPYVAGVLRGKVVSVSSQWIKIRLEKCSGTFTTDNTVYIKDANVCGTIIAADYISNGWWYREVTIPNNLVTGQWKIYYPIVVSSNGTKWYCDPIKIRG